MRLLSGRGLQALMTPARTVPAHAGPLRVALSETRVRTSGCICWRFVPCCGRGRGDLTRVYRISLFLNRRRRCGWWMLSVLSWPIGWPLSVETSWRDFARRGSQACTPPCIHGGASMPKEPSGVACNGLRVPRAGAPVDANRGVSFFVSGPLGC